MQVDDFMREIKQSEIAAANMEIRPATARGLLERIRARGVRFVDFWFIELNGKPWRICMAADLLTEKNIEEGIVLDGKSIGGSWQGFILLLPDPSSAYMDPIAPSPTLSLLCDVSWAGSRHVHALDPRQTLKRAQAYLARSQAASYVVGIEPEFFLLKDGEAESQEAAWEFLRTMASALSQAGIQVDWFRFGQTQGQGRVQMRAKDALCTADQVILYKNIARNIARREGRIAAFLPKPLANGTGNMYVHHALWRDGVNLFHDAGGWAFTSELARWYAGGLLKHARALVAFCAPSMNSYRRLIPGTGAPTDIVLSRRLDSAVCRIPAGSTGPTPGARRVKFCPSDPTANPYLALAAMLMAGLDGIENRIEPLTDEDGKTEFERIPHTLEEALQALEKDNDFLKKDGVFTEELIRTWISQHWKEQVLPVRSQPHPWELRLEFDH